MRGTALAPMSSDSLSSLNVPENIPSMAENTVYDKYSPSNGEQSFTVSSGYVLGAQNNGCKLVG